MQLREQLLNIVQYIDSIVKKENYVGRQLWLPNVPSVSYISDLVKKYKFTGVDVSVTGQNLGYLSNSKLYSPEVGGSLGGGYPLPCSVVFGLNLRF